VRFLKFQVAKALFRSKVGEKLCSMKLAK